MQSTIRVMPPHLLPYRYTSYFSIAALALFFVPFAFSKEILPHEVVFLGQIYPSGRIYLKPFPAKAAGPVAEDVFEQYTHALHHAPTPLDSLSTWPKEVLAVNIDPNKTLDKKAIRAWFEKVLVDDTTRSPRRDYATEYIPGLEGMDSSHCYCGMSKNKQDTSFRYESSDFFASLPEHCESTQGVAVYRSDFVSRRSFWVLAFAKGLQWTVFEIDTLRSPRRVQPGEKIRVSDSGYATRHLTLSYEDEVEALSMGEEENDACLYGRRMRSDARRLVSIKLVQPAWELELSMYRDPLCFMHWNDLYLLDVRENGKRSGKSVRTLELVQYQGMQ